MRRAAVRRWKNIGRVAGGSAVVGLNVYGIKQSFGLLAGGKALGGYATAKLAARHPRLLRAAAGFIGAHGIASGVGGIGWGAKLVRRGVQGLRGRAHAFHGNQYVKLGARRSVQRSTRTSIRRPSSQGRRTFTRRGGR